MLQESELSPTFLQKHMGDAETTAKRRRIRRRKNSRHEETFLDLSSDDEKVKVAAKPPAKSPSSSSSESDSSSKTPVSPAKKETRRPKKEQVQRTDSSASSDASSDASSSDEPDAEENVTLAEVRQPLTYARDSPPPLIDYKDPTIQQRFRTWYLTQITSEFGDELDTIRKTETISGGTLSSKKNARLTRSKEAIEESRLEVLIDALASGVDVFDENEMEMLLGKAQASEQDTEMIET